MLKLFESKTVVPTCLVYLLSISLQSVLNNGDPLVSPGCDLADGPLCVWVIYVDPSSAAGHAWAEACLAHLNLNPAIASRTCSSVLSRDLTSLQVDRLANQINQLFCSLLSIELALGEA